MIQLRDYQRAAVDSVYQYFMQNDGWPLIVLPTGTGKSLVLSDFCKGAIESYPNTRILILTHVKELISQDYDALKSIWEEAPAGIYSAGLGRRDLHSQILFAGIQSIHKKIDKIDAFDLVIVDEAHLIPRKSDTMYGRTLDALKAKNPSVKVVGLTATPYRLDTGMLHKGKDALFDAICFEADVADMIEQGYLSEPRPKAMDTKFDLTGVHKRGGDFIAGELEAAINTDELTQSAVTEIVAHGKDRGSWIAFCAGVKHAEAVAAEIREYGITCETVIGDTPPAERARIIREFKSGKIQALTNAMVLTTGFDSPGIDMICDLQPTQSVGLHVQKIGRGLRLAEGKEDCLILDFAGNTARHGPLDALNVRDKNETDGTGDAPVKICPRCAEICHAAVCFCPCCGHEFPPREIKLSSKAATDALLTKQIVSAWKDVSNVTYALHEKRDGGIPSLRVTYRCGMTTFSEWICFEHHGFALQKAHQWWMQRMPQYPPPSSIEESLRASEYLPSPIRICTKAEGKYTKITAVEF